MRNFALMLTLLILCGCSSTSSLTDDETLYVGIKDIAYANPSENILSKLESTHFETVQAEVEAALDCAPNGAFLGSSSIVTPFPIRLWIYNKYANSTSGFGKWMRNSFGTEPVLMESVNPEMRSQVATNVLRNNGYFNAAVDYDIITQKNPKKQKISYNVKAGKLYVVDTLMYVGFPAEMDSLIRANTADAQRMKSGSPFTVAQLDEERARVSNILRNNGYYYYNTAYSTFMADSVANPGRIEVHLTPVADIPAEATRKWYLGKLNITMRRSNNEPITDTLDHRFLTVAYSGKKMPLRPRAILRDIKVRPKQLYSQSNFDESSDILNSMGLFSMANFTLTPRDTSALCDTLDVHLNCTFDKPYDATLEANYKIKSNDRTGPGLTLGLTKRNAFRGGEKLSLNLRGSYEWQTNSPSSSGSERINSYEYGGDITIEYPRIEAPFGIGKRKRFFAPPSTQFTLKADVHNRPDYYKMLTVGASVNYHLRTSATSEHEFSPFTLDYTYMYNFTDKFTSVADANPSILISMSNQFVPKMKYTYRYTSPKSYRSPIKWETTVTEAGNLMSLAYMAFGKEFNHKGKELFNNPFAQFLKVNTDFRKTRSLRGKSQIVGRASAGVIWSYGNSDVAPYLEQFYVGGANSVRGFAIRSLGPGSYNPAQSTQGNLDRTGDFKLEFNLEYRFNITGGLYGALFLDAGNVWMLRDNHDLPGGTFRIGNLLDELATGTGLGIRYDLDFFVIRFDVGCAIHAPYDTGKSGYYNIPKFSDGLAYHFAIGYPF